jgi:hypothetical protein
MMGEKWAKYQKYLDSTSGARELKKGEELGLSLTTNTHIEH